MRTAITLTTAAALILAGGVAKITTSKTFAEAEAAKPPIKSYRLHFADQLEGRYCPGQFGREPEPEFLLTPC